MAENTTLPTETASQAEVEAFLRQVAILPQPFPTAGHRARLMFALDATASRQPTWDRACQLQGDMFTAAAALGGLDIKLVYFRGYGECRAAPWLSNAAEVARRMTTVMCQAGYTQWRRVLDHALLETGRERVAALVCVGDAVEEDVDVLGDQAGRLGVLGVPVFLFHEGSDGTARRAFQEMARLSGGAYCAFDGSSARQLGDLLAAVAVYAAGGRLALEDFGRRGGGAVVRLLTDQMGGRGR